MRFAPHLNFLRSASLHSVNSDAFLPFVILGDFSTALFLTIPGTRKPRDVLNFSRDKDKYHPTQKPVALCEYLIRTYTNEGETVLDNCMGSGSVGVACVNTGRNFIGIEIDENYFNIAKERISNANNPKN